jgi:hypothetical protein
VKPRVLAAETRALAEKTRFHAPAMGGAQWETRARRYGALFFVACARVVAMEAGDLAEGTRALAQSVRSVQRGTGGLALAMRFHVVKSRFVEV